MAKPVVIASLTFRTKTAAKELFRTIRDRCDDGERINTEDDCYFRDLIAIHPESETKMECGISHFTPAAGNQIVTELTCPNQLRNWQKFHRKHVKLRVLSPRGNISDAKLPEEYCRYGSLKG